MHSPPKRPFEASRRSQDLLADSAVMEEIQNRQQELFEKFSKAFPGRNLPVSSDLLTEAPVTLERMAAGAHAPRSPDDMMVEAIIEEWGRPSLIIENGIWKEPELQEIKQRLDNHRSHLENAIPSVGRVELINHPTHDYVGTAWMIDEDVVITNRHVAETFAERNNGLFSFIHDQFTGEQYRAEIDFNEEHQTAAPPQLAKVSEIIYIEAYRSDLPDMAIMRVKTLESNPTLPPPLQLAQKSPEFNEDIAVVGYPAKDSRNDAFVMHDIFDGIYNVKRLAPGQIKGVSGKVLTHDCSTLGGNSGSPIIQLSTGHALGLHYAGSYRKANYAVTNDTLRAKLDQLEHQQYYQPTKNFSSPENAAETSPEEERAPARADLTAEQGRKGYDPDFLVKEVPLPSPNENLSNLIAPVEGNDDGILDYIHYSVMMHRERRMAMFTAVNIDGKKMFRFTRGRDKWYLDPRLDKEHQVGHELYYHTHLHRGHLVRRLDPVWGDTREEAKQAEKDTFFFTNCTPQHRRFNPRSWLRLEDYILNNAVTHELKVSVFTGPVLKESDPPFRECQVPEEYWKVVSIINSYTGKLSCTAYLLSQSEFMDDLEFVYGKFRTYQVPVKSLEKKTGLSFGCLTRYDPMKNLESMESTSRQYHPVEGDSDIIL